MHYVHEYTENKNVFSECLNESLLMAGPLRLKQSQLINFNIILLQQTAKTHGNSTVQRTRIESSETRTKRIPAQTASSPSPWIVHSSMPTGYTHISTIHFQSQSIY